MYELETCFQTKKEGPLLLKAFGIVEKFEVQELITLVPVAISSRGIHTVHCLILLSSCFSVTLYSKELTLCF